MPRNPNVATPLDEAADQVRRATVALYLEVPESVAEGVRGMCESLIKEALAVREVAEAREQKLIGLLAEAWMWCALVDGGEETVKKLEVELATSEHRWDTPHHLHPQTKEPRDLPDCRICYPVP